VGVIDASPTIPDGLSTGDRTWADCDFRRDFRGDRARCGRRSARSERATDLTVRYPNGLLEVRLPVVDVEEPGSIHIEIGKSR
jgi:hypothetical protein